MERTLPVDTTDTSKSVAKKQPWLLHSMPVNAMNFCAFAMCRDGMPGPDFSKAAEPILVTVPNAIDSSGVRPFWGSHPHAPTLTICAD